MLCVNFDDSKFHELNCQLLRIIHPDMFVKNYLSDVSYNVLYDDFKKEADEDNAIYLYTVDVEQNNFFRDKINRVF